MGTWTLVLFLVTFQFGTLRGVAIDHLDGFSNEAACEAGKNQIMEKLKKKKMPEYTFVAGSLMTVCIEKK